MLLYFLDQRLLEKIFHKEEVLYANLRKIEMFLLFFSLSVCLSEIQGPRVRSVSPSVLSQPLQPWNIEIYNS